LLAVKNIASELRAKHKVDEFFYPNISMNIQIPDGLEGEISDIARVLKKSGLEVSSSNVLRVMELKKDLLTRYAGENKRQKIVIEYQELLEKKVKPVGSAIPLELIFVNGIVIILLSVVARFALSFADEAGKIMARRILDDDKKQSKKANMTIDEYCFLKTEAKYLIDKEVPVLISLKRSKRVRKKRQLQTNRK
jgi:hypothetical protein